MSNAVSLTTKVALSMSLTAVELGLFVRGKALLASGKKAFSIADLGEEEGIAGAAIERLLQLQLINHKGGGWYGLARRPFEPTSVVGMVEKLAATTAIKKPSSKDGRFELLRNELNRVALEIFRYKPVSTTYSTNSVNRSCYRKIFKIIDEYKSDIETFVWFVFQHDWNWTKAEVPYPPTFSHDQFLGTFIWYVQNKDVLNSSSQLLDSYDKVFGIVTKRNLDNLRLGLQLQNKLEESNISRQAFLDYIQKLNWTSMGGFPPLQLLLTKIVDQCSNALRVANGITSTDTITSTYLGRIIDRIRRIPKEYTDVEFEDHNWLVAEAILEPMYPIVSSNGMPSHLGSLIEKAVTEKSAPEFGSHMITYSGKLSPTGVWAIVYAANHLEGTICPPEFGDWKETVSEFASDYVDLAILEERL